MRVIAGSKRGVRLQTPDGMLTRPTADRVKEALFSMINFDLPGARVLDLFGGTGQLGIEALSRGAASAVFVDHRAEACDLIRENLKRTGLTAQAKVVRADYMQYLENCRETFDIVLLDPPYAEIFLENSLKKLIEIDILQSGGIIIAEYPVLKSLEYEFPGYQRNKDHKYGKTMLAVYRKIASGDQP